MQVIRILEQLESRRVFASDWQNASLPCDVDQSAYVSPLDALVVINQLNRVGSGSLPARELSSADPFFDVNGDGFLSPLDALLVINALNVRREEMRLPTTASGALSAHLSSSVNSSNVGFLDQSEHEEPSENIANRWRIEEPSDMEWKLLLARIKAGQMPQFERARIM